MDPDPDKKNTDPTDPTDPPDPDPQHFLYSRTIKKYDYMPNTFIVVLRQRP